MLGLRDKKDMVKRPDDEPKFDKNNKVDRTIVKFVVIGVSVALVLLAGFIILYYTLFARGN